MRSTPVPSIRSRTAWIDSGATIVCTELLARQLQEQVSKWAGGGVSCEMRETWYVWKYSREWKVSRTVKAIFSEGFTETMSTEIYFQWVVRWNIGNWNLFKLEWLKVDLIVLYSTASLNISCTFHYVTGTAYPRFPILLGNFLRVLFIKSKSIKKLTLTLYYTIYHMRVLVRRQLMVKKELCTPITQNQRTT